KPSGTLSVEPTTQDWKTIFEPSVATMMLWNMNAGIIKIQLQIF
ncbi:MAG: hypothetical protein JWQ40_3002, partial [Segetibacter sp.]|nr:hypothetical protein [Segetibacter sp.]